MLDTAASNKQKSRTDKNQKLTKHKKNMNLTQNQNSTKKWKIYEFNKKWKINNKKIKNAPKTKLDTISLFRNDLELFPKRREPQQRPLSPRCGTSSWSSLLSSRKSKNHNLVSPSWNLILRFRTSFHNEVIEDVVAVRIVLEPVRDRSWKVIWC